MPNSPENPYVSEHANLAVGTDISPTTDPLDPEVAYGKYLDYAHRKAEQVAGDDIYLAEDIAQDALLGLWQASRDTTPSILSATSVEVSKAPIETSIRSGTAE